MSILSKINRKINVGSTLWRWYSKFKTDPGINLRKKMFNSPDELEDVDFDDLETDFMNIHKTHKEHVTEIEAGLEKQKFHIIKQKYFKENNFNFLTWHDKEQIRYLHSTNPEEWTVEKLSEGFPALPHIINKILKSKWTISPTRVSTHDRTVQKNWENFRKGQIPNLPKDLVDHLNKFTNRALNFKPFEVPTDKTVIKTNINPKNTEFSDIITSYERLKSKNNFKDPVEEQINVFPDTKNMKDNHMSKTKNKPITLNHLQNKLERRLNKGKELSEDEKLIVKNLKTIEVNNIEINKNNLEIESVTQNKYNTTACTSIMEKNKNDFNHLLYPEKIIIPKNQRKKGNTYKLNDCYYDYDGQFLYRVPGMY